MRRRRRSGGEGSREEEEEEKEEEEEEQKEEEEEEEEGKGEDGREGKGGWVRSGRTVGRPKKVRLAAAALQLDPPPNSLLDSSPRSPRPRSLLHHPPQVCSSRRLACRGCAHEPHLGCPPSPWPLVVRSTKHSRHGLSFVSPKAGKESIRELTIFRQRFASPAHGGRQAHLKPTTGAGLKDRSKKPAGKKTMSPSLATNAKLPCFFTTANSSAPFMARTWFVMCEWIALSGKRMPSTSSCPCSISRSSGAPNGAAPKYKCFSPA